MEIISLQIRSKGEAVGLHWRMQSGLYRNIWACCLSEVDTNSVFRLLLGLWNDQSMPDLAYGKVEVADTKGEIWAFEYRDGKKLIRLNGSALEFRQGFQLFKNEMNQSDANLLDLISVFDVAGRGANLRVHDFTTKPQLSMTDLWYEEIDTLADECSKTLGMSHSPDVSHLKELGLGVAEYREKFLRLEYLNAEFPRTLPDETHFKIDSQEGLREQIRLLTSIHELTQQLSAPELDEDSTRKKLLEIEKEIANGLQDCGLSQFPSIGDTFDVERAVELLGMVSAREKLVRFFDKAALQIGRGVQNLIQQSMQGGDQVLKMEKLLLKRLDESLAQLMEGSGVKLLETDIAAESEQAGWFEKLKADKAAFGGRATSIEKSVGVIRKTMADAMAEFSNLKDHRQQLLKINQHVDKRLGQFKEQQLIGLGDAKKKWIQFAREHSLPFDLSLSRLFTILGKVGKLHDLDREVDQLQKLGFQRKSLVDKLESEIYRWRRISGSQKCHDLDHIHLLMEEAKSLLRFLEEKKRQLATAERVAEKRQLGQHFDHWLAKEVETLSKGWEDFLEKNNLNRISLKNKRLDDFSRKVRCLEAFLTESKYEFGAEGGEQRPGAFEDSASGYFHFWRLKSSQENGAERLEFAKNLCARKSTKPHLIFTEDAQLMSILEGSGVGRLISVPWQQAQKESPVVESPRPSEPTLVSGRQLPTGRSQELSQRPQLSTKAQAAMDIFSRKV